MTIERPYPLHVDGTLDPHLSRGLWIVKWLLALPHWVVLAFLWVAFAVLSVAAFVAILVTGRYPRPIFDFNVGVLRWSWRVSYYAYGALGTDRYPPFTLAEVPDYPAHLSVDFPERLSRGLVLVKWWLLALPHYLVVALLVGGGWYAVDATGERQPAAWGLIGILVLVAAVVLLFTGRYPRPIFDLVLGLNRWVLRVAAYAALMTDVYPPFRLDMGGPDPGVTLPERTSDPQAPPSGGTATGWTAGRVTGVVLGSLLTLVSAGLVACGAALAVADSSQRDGDGYLMTEPIRLTSEGHALASDEISVHAGAPVDVPRRLLGDARLKVTTTGSTELFVGVAPTSEAADYLAGVGHSTLTGIEGEQPQYDHVPGGPPTQRPADADLWAASTTGAGSAALSWRVESGEWTVVVMRADGTTPVDVEVAVGATMPALGTLVAVLLSAGGTLLLLSLALVLGSVLAARGVNDRH